MESLSVTLVTEWRSIRVCQQVGVADARQKIVKFGALHIGQTLKKIIPVVNNSAAPLTFNVTLNPVTPELQEPGVVRLLPSEQPITLQAKGGMTKVEVMLSPKTRICQFSEEVIHVQLKVAISSFSKL